MGAIDLVIQIESPPSIDYTGMQRVGRASHHVGAVSNAVIFPKYRADLVACAAITQAMNAGQIESVRYHEIRSMCWRSKLWPWWGSRIGTLIRSSTAVRASRAYASLDADDA